MDGHVLYANVRAENRHFYLRSVDPPARRAGARAGSMLETDIRTRPGELLQVLVEPETSISEMWFDVSGMEARVNCLRRLPLLITNHY